MFNVTTNQLTKAVTGIDYEGGPHPSKRKRPIDADSTTTPAKTQKTGTQAKSKRPTGNNRANSKSQIH